MKSSEIIARLGQSLENLGDSFFEALGTVARPALDEDEKSHYDWLLVKKRGIEVGFVDGAYFDGQDEQAWGRLDLRLVQVTFYSDTRPGIRAYAGELPWQLSMDDDRESARRKMAAFENTQRSYITDCWEVAQVRVVVAYRAHGKGLDSVHINLIEPELDESRRLQPAVPAEAWLGLFGLHATSSELANALAPLNVPARIEENDDEREVDFIDECGISLYFEEGMQLRTARGSAKDSQLVFGAVKFYRARDLGSRQFRGALPMGLHFDDSPAMLLKKLRLKPARHNDDRLTGSALWHFETFSLHVLYSTVENQLLRVMLMASGYWQELAALD